MPSSKPEADVARDDFGQVLQWPRLPHRQPNRADDGDREADHARDDDDDREARHCLIDFGDGTGDHDVFGKLPISDQWVADDAQAGAAGLHRVERRGAIELSAQAVPGRVLESGWSCWRTRSP